MTSLSNASGGIAAACLLAGTLALCGGSQQSSSAPPPGKEQALARIREGIRGRENEPAERVFQNIELLRGKPASRLPGMMSALTGLLGVSCEHCHVPGRWESEELTPKRTARRHFRMQAELNREYFDGSNAISCWTCHRGEPCPPSP